MSGIQNKWAQLKNTFEQDLNITEQLIGRLQKERQALETRNYEQFQQIVGEKQTLLALLESHVSRRRQWLEQAGFSDEASALASAKQQAPDVAAIWHTLEEQWTHCQQLNEVNEHIANRTRAIVSHVLDTLRGQTHQSNLYNNKGDTQTSGTGQTISNA